MKNLFNIINSFKAPFGHKKEGIIGNFFMRKFKLLSIGKTPKKGYWKIS